jgi:hypothetical protein
VHQRNIRPLVALYTAVLDLPCRKRLTGINEEHTARFPDCGRQLGCQRLRREQFDARIVEARPKPLDRRWPKTVVLPKRITDTYDDDWPHGIACPDRA